MNQLTRDRLHGYNDFDVEDIHEQRMKRLLPIVEKVIKKRMFLADIKRAVGDKIGNANILDVLSFSDKVIERTDLFRSPWEPKDWRYNTSGDWAESSLPAREAVV